MVRIKKLKENETTIYPATIPQAVVDPTTGKTLADMQGRIAFVNSDDAINIDNYPQAEYGTVVIWYNRAEADGAPPGQEGVIQEGVIYQTKYRSELGESGSTYVDCLTQLYVGSGGIKHRTVIDYDDASKFDGMAWS